MKKYIHYGSEKFHREYFCKIGNMLSSVKPNGGLWACDVDSENSWKDFCDRSSFRKCEEKNSFTFSLSNDARILTINSLEDMECLQKIKHDTELCFCNLSWICLDFEKIAEDYDVLEVNISHDYRLYYKLYGWDCDSILVMNPDVIVEEND